MDTARVPMPDGNQKDGDRGSAEEKRGKKARKPSASARSSGGARYFLAVSGAASDASSLALGEEFPSEDEVLVASFQKGISFYRVETWKTRAEKKGRNMVLRKQS
jgi:hypothetical protein